MKPVLAVVSRVSRVLHDVAGAALTFMMCITVVDVLGRATGHPVMGTYEIVGLTGAVVIGFAVPFTSWDKGHIYMEFVLDRLSKSHRNLLLIFTRLLCIVLFIFIGYNLLQVAADYRRAGEVSATLLIPIFPVAYGVAVCCFIECAVFLCDIVRIWEGTYE